MNKKVVWAFAVFALFLGAKSASAQSSVNPNFEIGVRYWDSTGDVNWAFAFGDFRGFGDPTATIDWQNMPGHSGEIFARFDHSSRLFVKGIAGLGKITGGTMSDSDFLIDQVKFSDYSSRIKGMTAYGLVDLGIAHESKKTGSRIGVFAGYHFWRDKIHAFGLTDNILKLDDPRYTTDTEALIYEPTWHVMRVGVDGRVSLGKKMSATMEYAWVPFGRVNNDDSHMLKTSPALYGPVPNVLTKSASVRGNELQASLNYALTPRTEFGIGVRYWDLHTSKGTVEFGPFFQNYPLRKLEEARYGILLQIAQKF